MAEIIMCANKPSFSSHIDIDIIIKVFQSCDPFEILTWYSYFTPCCAEIKNEGELYLLSPL
jgi:hypothetical protein